MPRKANQPNLREKAYCEIKERILSGDLKGSTLISEYQLSDEMKISRTPIREALRDLQKAGLVEIYPQRGALVVELTEQDLNEIFSIKELIEGHCAAEITRQGKSSVFDKLQEIQVATEEALSRGDRDEAYATATKLHEIILSSARNRRLISMMELLQDQVFRINQSTLRLPNRLEETVAEHSAIVEAVRSGKPDAARDKMVEHLRLDKAAAVSALFEAD